MIIEKDKLFIPSSKLTKELAELVVSKDILLETTFAQIMANIKNTANFNTRKRQWATQPLVVDQIQMNPFKGTKTLLVRSLVKSDSGKKYDTQISFLRVKYLGEDEEGVDFTASDSKVYTIEQLDLTKTDVQVRCACLDFRFRAAWHNGKKKSLFGRMPPPYKKKTDRPSVNPNKVEAVCKHLIVSFEAIIQSGLAKPFNTKP